MRAIRQMSLGGPEVLELADVPRPEPGPTEVLVRVTAAGVNPVDWKVRARGAASSASRRSPSAGTSPASSRSSAAA